MYSTICAALERAESVHTADTASPPTLTGAGGGALLSGAAPQSKKRVIVITDGEDGGDSGVTLATASAAIARRGGPAAVRLYFIAIGGVHATMLELAQGRPFVKIMACEDGRQLSNAMCRMVRASGSQTPPPEAYNPVYEMAQASGGASPSWISRGGSRGGSAGGSGSNSPPPDGGPHQNTAATVQAAADLLTLTLQGRTPSGEPADLCAVCSRMYQEADLFCPRCGRSRLPQDSSGGATPSLR